MKRTSLFVLLTVLCCCVLSTTALANSWGLKGPLLEAVSDDPTWHDYSTIASQAGDIAVMGSRYHNALMLLKNHQLQVYTTAVYQPGEAPGRLSLSMQDDRLVLSYGNNETYVFVEDNDDYYLYAAQIGNFGLKSFWEDGFLRYLAYDGQQEALCRRDFRLKDFNIELFPCSVEEVRHLNFMHAALSSGSDVLGWWDGEEPYGRLYHGVGKKTTPVYAAPFGASAWRAAQGKAAVDLSGDLWCLRYVTNADGEAYACIRYNVSERTQRIGYIPASILGQDASDTSIEDLLHVDVRATQTTYLTDDPDVSQYPQIDVPKDTLFICLGLYGDEYAYVAGEVRNNRFTGGGAIIWGFVPLRDVELATDLWYPQQREDIMAQLAGCWYFDAGGSMAQEALELHMDGTYRAVNGYDERFDTLSIATGTWYVSDYHDAWNLYWDVPAYQITFLDDNGTVNIKGLSINEDHTNFSLTNHEGGGGYSRMTPDNFEEISSFTTFFVMDENQNIQLRE